MDKTSNIQALRAALAVSPENVPLLKMYGEACIAEWSLKEARDIFERVLTLDPQDFDARLAIARILYQTGSISESAVRVESLSRERPDSADVWHLLSKLAVSEGNLEQARSHFLKARELSPSLRDGALEKEFNLNPAPAEPAEPERPKLVNSDLGWEAEEDMAGGEDLDEGLVVDELEGPVTTFGDVGGMEDVKEEIRMKILYPLQKPELFRAYGKKTGGGVLLYGPPGCGKTLISRATAGEIKAKFISIGLHQILDMYIGNSEKNLHELFELARAHRPSVLFVDEIDALAADRKDLKQSAARTLINQLLAEMDGQAYSNEGVLIIGATNAPWHIDPAFRRPGRFDRIIFVPTPDEKARIDIIRILVRDKPVQDIDIKALAQKTKDFSGADLKSLFDAAVEQSLTKAMKEERIIPITTADLLRAAKSVVPSSKAWFESAKNYALYANQSGFYDPILAFLGIKK